MRTRTPAALYLLIVLFSMECLAQPKANQTDLVSVHYAGTIAYDKGGDLPQISADGRYIVFTSKAKDLIPNYVDNFDMPWSKGHIFLRDLLKNETRLVDAKAGQSSQTSEGSIAKQTLTPDGRFIIFEAFGRDLESGIVDENGGPDTVIYDIDKQKISYLLKAPAQDRTVDSATFYQAISGNGTLVLIASKATNIIPELSLERGPLRFFLANIETGIIDYLPMALPADAPDTPLDLRTSVSSDGKEVWIDYSNKTTFRTEFFAYDIPNHTLRRLSDTEQSFADAVASTPDGRFLVFSESKDIVDSDRNGYEDLYWYDMSFSPPKVQLVSGNPIGLTTTTGEIGSEVSISDDGRYVAFTYWGNGLTEDSIAPDIRNIYVRDMKLRVTSLISRDWKFSLGANCDCYRPKMSRQATLIMFASCATNLDNTGGSPIESVEHTFISSLDSGKLPTPRQTWNVLPYLQRSAMSSDGRYLVFSSPDPLLTNISDTNDQPDVFVRSFTDAPIFSEAGIVDGAAFTPRVSAGSWFSIFGTKMAGGTRGWQADDFNGLKLPKALDGVQVKLNGSPVPISFVSPYQINALIPVGVSGSATVQVVSTEGEGSRLEMEIRPYGPEFFALEPEARKFAAAVHGNGSYVGEAGLLGPGVTSSPAKVGEAVMLFGTGFGPTNPPAPADSLLPGPLMLSNPAALTMRIGGKPAKVEFAGLTGVGLYQVNVVIPDLANGNHEIEAEIMGVKSEQRVFISVIR